MGRLPSSTAETGPLMSCVRIAAAARADSVGTSRPGPGAGLYANQLASVAVLFTKKFEPDAP